MIFCNRDYKNLYSHQSHYKIGVTRGMTSIRSSYLTTCSFRNANIYLKPHQSVPAHFLAAESPAMTPGSPEDNIALARAEDQRGTVEGTIDVANYGFERLRER
jgi:hypothetical protein